MMKIFQHIGFIQRLQLFPIPSLMRQILGLGARTSTGQFCVCLKFSQHALIPLILKQRDNLLRAHWNIFSQKGSAPG
jgi:hypothetical protein